jgi:pseudaminic acid cytidylyltransferase
MNLCVIPARGGSKRVPKKNINPFNGKPIIAYSIEAALKSNCFHEVIVSTDNSEIANVAKSYGAIVPFIRPDELADDYTDTLSVIKHSIEWFEQRNTKYQYICCLYATAPFISANNINKAYQQLKESGTDYCFSVTSFPFPIQRAFKRTSDNRIEMFYPEHIETRSQDLEEAFHDAGQFYWGKAKVFKEKLPIFSKHSTPFLLPSYLVQDIDTLEDWKKAELMYQVVNKMEKLK